MQHAPFLEERSAWHPAVRCSREAADGVIGEADLRCLAPGQGAASAGTLTSFAEDLCGRGARLHLVPGVALRLTDTKTIVFRTCECAILLGTAVPLHVGPDSAVWQAMIHDEEGVAIAVVTQTYLLKPAGRPSVADLPDGAAAAPKTGGARIDAILAAGSRVIAERGFANATTKEIAAAAGMTAPTMYQYVRSKDELLFMICESCFRNLSGLVDEAISALTDPLDRLRAAISALVEASEEHRAEVRLLARETASLPPALRAKVHERWHAFLGRFADLVAEGTAAGRLRPIDPLVAAHLIESLCDVWALRRLALRPHGLEQIKAEIVQLILRGLCCEPAGSEPNTTRQEI
jgi:AcrR family transcriptional regulator/acyl-coenzyme A thioesterase PaaI-like protein